MKIRRRNKLGFYGFMLGANLMVGIAVVSFITPAPVQVMAATPVVASPKPATPEVVSVPAVVGNPVYIEVLDVGVSLDIAPGTYDTERGDWTLNYSGALHAEGSMPINDVNGVTLIYAHALAGLFGSLPSLQPGMFASVTTDNGRIFRYQYRSSVEVLPTDTSVFSAEGPPTLVLQTCSGAWDTHRALYYFDFVDEREA